MVGLRMQEAHQVVPPNIKAVGTDFHFLCLCVS